MRKLRVTHPADELPFMQIGDIITDYEVVHDSLTALIKVNTSSYAKDNKFEENGRFMWWASENFWVGFSNIEIIEDEGERKMKKFKLKVPKYSFDHEGMIIQGKLSSCEHEVEVYAIDLCYANMDIMSKMDIIQCMFKGNDFTWRYKLDKLEPLEPIKLTQLDYEMLKSIQKQGAKYICRDENGLINLCEKEPYIMDDDRTWGTEGQYDYLSTFTKQLFQFVTWESQKYYIIEDVLENCEIVED